MQACSRTCLVKLKPCLSTELLCMSKRVSVNKKAKITSSSTTIDIHEGWAEEGKKIHKETPSTPGHGSGPNLLRLRDFLLGTGLTRGFLAAKSRCACTTLLSHRHKLSNLSLTNYDGRKSVILMLARCRSAELNGWWWLLFGRWSRLPGLWWRLLGWCKLGCTLTSFTVRAGLIWQIRARMPAANTLETARPSQYGGCARAQCDDDECTCTGATWHSRPDPGDATRCPTRTIGPMLSARSRRQHTHTDARFTAYRRCGTRQSHSSSHTHAYARDPAVASTNNLDKNLKLTPNLRRLDVGSAPLLNYNLALVRASMVYVPAGCGLMPTSGRWSSMLVHSCTGSYKPDWANCFTGELRHEHANLHTGPSGRTCLTGDFHEHVHTVMSPSRRRFSRRTLRFRIPVVYEHNIIALRTRAIANLQNCFTTVQKSHVSSCCGLELISPIYCALVGLLLRRSPSLSHAYSRTCRSVVARCCRCCCCCYADL
ncbi:unnamed protein product [Trichogramma brassicae]|uniref:Uncharacterized protein n=1 Tax=Trichogramma brassicae TaxID=86971 RepID=A0A6H5I830_9HYME|nr:unnamed protein product [Trichogramma brassicae]